MHLSLKSRLRAMLVAACAVAALAGGAAQAQEIPLVTGEHWTKSTEQSKKAYLVGLTNMLQVEVAYQAGNTLPESQTVVPRFAKGLKGNTLDGAIAKVDAWYAKNPGRMQQPVIETIWYELVVPGLQQNK
ncbi:MAG: hypothetical protein U1F04_14000 [Burkholderiaceae bacterium]|jgi:hypothetical protein